jgi:glycosyltransferase involved in cell wall biosynthesis
MAFRNLSPAFSATLRNLLQQETFAVIQGESIEMGRYLLELRRKRGKQPRLVLDEFNAEYLLQKGAALTSIRERSAKGIAGAIYSLIQWQKLRAYERYLLQQCDHTLAVSEEDRLALLRLHPQAQISIIPNGVDSSSFTSQPSTSPSPPYRMVFTGTLDFRPNVDAVLWFARAILPLVQKQIPQVKFVIVGRTPSAEIQALHNGQSIEVWANVPEIYPFLAEAAVFVLPMRMGGGIRLKLLEALAMQLPTVSTPLGAMGVPELRNTEHLLLATTPEEFAEATLSLLKDEALGKRLGVAGRNLVQVKYDWQEVGRKLADTL